MEKIQEILAQKVRPILQAHNGNIQLAELTAEGFVKVKLTGVCASCPGAQQTVSELIEAALEEACPEIKGVIPIYQVSDDLINQALKILRKDNDK